MTSRCSANELHGQVHPFILLIADAPQFSD